MNTITRKEYRNLCQKIIKVIPELTLTNDFPTLFSTSEFLNKSSNLPYSQTKIGNLFVKTHFSSQGLTEHFSKLVKKYNLEDKCNEDKKIKDIDVTEKNYHEYDNCGFTDKISFPEFLQLKKVILLNLNS